MPADFRYLRYRAWWTAMGHTTSNELSYAFVAENLLETWIPPDRSRDWHLRRTLTGRRRWLYGDESTDAPAGWPTGDWRAPYGDFYAGEGRTPAESPPGVWHRPNPAWLAELPRDPGPLLDELRADLPTHHRRDDARVLHAAAQALCSGQLPAGLVRALYRGLAGLPGITVREDAADLDGRPGTALVAEDGRRIEELIIDPGAGVFLGERTTLTEPTEGIPAGTVIADTSLRTGWADALGAPPA